MYQEIVNAYIHDKLVFVLASGKILECRILKITDIDCELKIANTSLLLRRKFKDIKLTVYDS